MNYKCKFCSSELKITNDKVWNAYCDPCKTSYWITTNNKIKDYKFTYNEYDICFYLKSPLIFGIRLRKTWTYVIELDFIPNITPFNAEQKFNSIMNLKAFK